MYKNKKLNDFDVVRNAVANSRSIKEVLIALDMGLSSSSYRTIREVCNSYSLSLPVGGQRVHLEQVVRNLRLTAETIFTNGSVIRNTTTLKRIMLQEGGFEDKCSECGLLPIWNNKPITLQVDHIDGNRCNNLKTNLRILCPNCHTQTETYGSKNTTYR